MNNDLVNNIIDIFENFLNDKRIKIINPEKIEAEKCQNKEEIANIFGTDYGRLQTELEDLLKTQDFKKETAKIIAKVYGLDGHRQRMSFENSVLWDWSNETDGTRIFEAKNCDLTGTTEYSLIIITRNNLQECYDELNGQITDGYFENANVGKVEIIVEEIN